MNNFAKYALSDRRVSSLTLDRYVTSARFHSDQAIVNNPKPK